MLKWMGTVILPKSQNLTSMRQIGLFIKSSRYRQHRDRVYHHLPQHQRRAIQQSFLFNLRCSNRGIHTYLKEKTKLRPSWGKIFLQYTPRQVEYCIDAEEGNVAHFISAPNLFVQCVLSSHHDIKHSRSCLSLPTPFPPFRD